MFTIDSVPWRIICDALGISLIPPNAKVQKNGVIYILCPFHKEKTPSLKFWERTNTFRCFGCNKEGDKVNFITLYSKMPSYVGEEINLEMLIRYSLCKKQDPSQLCFDFYKKEIKQ